MALTVRVEQGSVSAHFRAETPAAQRWIETHQQELRAGLREQGLEVKDVVVTTDPDGRRDRRQDAPARASASRPPRRRAPTRRASKSSSRSDRPDPCGPEAIGRRAASFKQPGKVSDRRHFSRVAGRPTGRGRRRTR